MIDPFLHVVAIICTGQGLNERPFTEIMDSMRLMYTQTLLYTRPCYTLCVFTNHSVWVLVQMRT
jgi:ABC-type dipeptide/oligopeptide/nickel transport system ATPase component